MIIDVTHQQLLRRAQELISEGKAPGVYTGLAIARDELEQEFRAVMQRAADQAYAQAAAALDTELALVREERARIARGSDGA